jgi:PAS domain S-box-containing protein
MPRNPANSTSAINTQADSRHDNAPRLESAEIGHLTNLLMDSPAFICSLRGPHHIVELANKKFVAMNGGHELKGKPLLEALPEDESRFYFEILDRVYTTGQSFSAEEMPVLLKDNEINSFRKCFLNFVYQAIRDHDNEISGVLIHGIDVTDQVQRREATREKESWLRVMTNTMPQIVWMARPDGYFESVNKQGLDYLGINVAQSNGFKWSSVIHPDDVEQISNSWQHSLSSGETFEVECRIRHHDGKYRWFLNRALPVRDHHNNIMKWFGTCTDIEDWRQAKQKAEDANRVKDEFLATLSHELRTPLNAILGWVQLLRTGKLDEETHQKALEIIERSAQTQGQLIDDILDVSRIMSGKIRLDLKPIHLTEIVEATIEGARPSAVGRNITLEFDSLPHGGLVSGDAVRMQQVVWNLLTNAIKFTAEGGSIKVYLGEIDNLVNITVSDTGLGIEPELLPHVFDRFRQGNSSTNGNGGLGLGLSIVRQLVEAQGGTIQAFSEGIDKGATFTVSFPLLGSSEQILQTTPLRQAFSTGPSQRERRKSNNHQIPPKKTALNFDEITSLTDISNDVLNGMNVLIVDDEIDALKMLQALLNAYGAKVTVAYSAKEALAAISVQRPDVMISDIGMPDEDGYSLMHRLRAFESETGQEMLPAVAVTAFVRSSDKTKALDSGFQHHIPKPVEPSHLVALVSQLAKM